jgi:hypothetical protein
MFSETYDFISRTNLKSIFSLGYQLFLFLFRVYYALIPYLGMFLFFIHFKKEKLFLTVLTGLYFSLAMELSTRGVLSKTNPSKIML